MTQDLEADVVDVILVAAEQVRQRFTARLALEGQEQDFFTTVAMYI